MATFKMRRKSPVLVWQEVEADSLEEAAEQAKIAAVADAMNADWYPWPDEHDARRDDSREPDDWRDSESERYAEQMHEPKERL